MIKKTIILIFIFTTMFSFTRDNKEDVLNRLYGMWNPAHKEYRRLKTELPWGIAYESPNISVIFYHEYINATGFILKILDIKQKNDNQYIFKLSEAGNKFDMEIHFLDKNKIEIINGEMYFTSPYILKKIDGPEFNTYQFATPNVEKLSLREGATLKDKRIRMLANNEKLEILEKWKTETINGTKGTWVKVKTEKGEVGWCFDAYLEEVKKK